MARWVRAPIRHREREPACVTGGMEYPPDAGTAAAAVKSLPVQPGPLFHHGPLARNGSRSGTGGKETAVEIASPGPRWTQAGALRIAAGFHPRAAPARCPAGGHRKKPKRPHQRPFRVTPADWFQCTATSICRLVAFSAFGSVNFSTPSAYSATILASSIDFPRRSVRTYRPKQRSR